MLPFALATLNNDRVVVLGRRVLRDRLEWLMQIYEYYGQLIVEIPSRSEEYELHYIRNVDTNKNNNDIYVGDRGTGIIHRFTEGGAFISSFHVTGTNDNSDMGMSLGDAIGPLPICFCHTNKVVVASCITAVSRSILVLSSNLFLLGFFRSNEALGIPPVFRWTTQESCMLVTKLMAS